jgi:DoxX-like family
MFIAYVVIAVVVAALLAMSARGKLARNERIVTTLTGVGVPLSWFWWLASCEIAGAVGLLAGIFVAPFGIAAAIGLILYFLGAVSTHLRAGDVKGITAPAPLLVGAVAALVLRLAA